MRGSEFTKQAEALSDVPTGLPTLRGHCFAFFTHFVQKDAFHLRTHRTSTSFQYHKSICTICAGLNRGYNRKVGFRRSSNLEGIYKTLTRSTFVGAKYLGPHLQYATRLPVYEILQMSQRLFTKISCETPTWRRLAVIPGQDRQEPAGKVLLQVLPPRCVSSEPAQARADQETEAQTQEGCQVLLPCREAAGTPGKTQHSRFPTCRTGSALHEGRKGQDGR